MIARMHVALPETVVPPPLAPSPAAQALINLQAQEHANASSQLAFAQWFAIAVVIGVSVFLIFAGSRK